MKILVTGGLGFIGRHVCAYLRERGHEPLVLDRFKIFSKEKEPDDETYLGDVTNRSTMMDAVSRAEGVIHLAGILGTQESVQNPYPAAEVNILGSLNVLEALAHYDVPAAFIGIGNHWMNNPYSISKSAADRFALMYAKERGVRVNVVRAVNAYGPGQKAAAPYGVSKVRKVVPSFICRSLNDDPIEIYGDGDQYADMIYVTDVAKALSRALMKAYVGEIFEKVVEVGPVEHTSVKQLARRIKSLTNSKSNIVHLPMRPGEVAQDVTADVFSMGLIGMNAGELVPLSQGLDKTIEYYRA